jgi:hypothetical protein
MEKCSIIILERSDGISSFLSICFEIILDDKCEIAFERHVGDFYRRLKSHPCDIPVVIFNPYIDEIDSVWPLITSIKDYSDKRFLIFSNEFDPLRREELFKSFVRENFDFKFGIPFVIQELIDAVEMIRKI